MASGDPKGARMGCRSIVAMVKRTPTPSKNCGGIFRARAAREKPGLLTTNNSFSGILKGMFKRPLGGLETPRLGLCAALHYAQTNEHETALCVIGAA